MRRRVRCFVVGLLFLCGSHIFAAVPAEGPRFTGRMPVAVGSQDELSFAVWVDGASSADRVRVELRLPGAPPQIIERTAALGQEIVSNAYFVQLPERGPVVCIEWALGARSVGLTVYGIESGAIAVLLDESCDHGFQFVDLDGDGRLSLVAVDRSEGGTGYRARIFALTASGGFEEVRTELCANPHHYRLITGQRLE